MGKLTILTLLVTEVLGDGETSKGDTGTGTWGLVHLTEDKGDLGLAVELNDTSLLHFVVQIVTLTSTLTDTSEDRVTTVSLGDVVLWQLSVNTNWTSSGIETYDKLLNEDGLADTSTTEKANFSTTSVRCQKVDNLDTSNQDFGRCGLLLE